MEVSYRIVVKSKWHQISYTLSFNSHYLYSSVPWYECTVGKVINSIMSEKFSNVSWLHKKCNISATSLISRRLVKYEIGILNWYLSWSRVIPKYSLFFNKVISLVFFGSKVHIQWYTAIVCTVALMLIYFHSYLCLI